MPCRAVPCHARIRYESGDVYAGDFSRGLRHGEGALRCVGGEIYEGEWADDLKHGGGAQHHGLQTLCATGCNTMCYGLQLYVLRAATLCATGCNPMCEGLQPYDCARAATLCERGHNLNLPRPELTLNLPSIYPSRTLNLPLTYP